MLASSEPNLGGGSLEAPTIFKPKLTAYALPRTSTTPFRKQQTRACRSPRQLYALWEGALVPGNGPAKRQVELMTCRRAATADGSDGAGARRGGPEEVAICARKG